jgi:hypothetical protein
VGPCLHDDIVNGLCAGSGPAELLSFGEDKTVVLYDWRHGYELRRWIDPPRDFRPWTLVPVHMSSSLRDFPLELPPGSGSAHGMPSAGGPATPAGSTASRTALQPRCLLDEGVLSSRLTPL